ncbi:MAG: DUF6198 family protein [Methanobrevibacter sp.]|nr:DUF6198 family protein [Methanobrevibacter sp.]
MPYVSSLIANLSVGTTSFIFSIILIAIQVILLRGGFERRQFLQIVIGTIFSLFIDVTLMLINFINPTDYISQVIVLLASCVVMAFGVLLEVKTEVVFIPGEGFIVAISKVLKKEFGKVKPCCDVSFVITAAILSFAFLGYLAGVREGTVISALIIGPIVRIFKKYIGGYVDALIEV